MNKTDEQFKNNRFDWTAIAAKASLSAIPVAGGFLAEVVGVLIPNQRIDRVAKYCSELDSELENLPEEVIKSLRNNEQFIELVEESFMRAARSSSDERRKYILNIVQNGITDGNAEMNNARYLLGLLSELNDNEVIWLRYFHERAIGDRSKLQALHGNILAPVRVVLGSSKEERQRGAIQDSYREHLERLGLVENEVRMDKDLGVPEYDTFTHKPKTSYTRTTTLGDMLLEQIGLIK